MVQFLLEIARFALQGAIIVACLIIFVAFVASILSKDKQDSELKIKDLNKQLKKNRNSLLKKQLDKKQFKAYLKEQKQLAKKENTKSNMYVLQFDGDIKASAVEQLREEISTVLSVAKKTDQIVLKLESPGGMVHGYGLAASQLERIKSAGIPLTIAVDKIAASGGYMMACLADQIIAAPFAIIGSIGVVASMPNFNKVLKKNDVDYLEITAGEFKRTLTPLGEITDSGMKKFKDQIEEVHELFKNHVSTQRPKVELSKVATGEYWYGQQALDLLLVDKLSTSDEFLMSHLDSHQLYEVTFAGKKSLKEKISENLGLQFESLITKVSTAIWKKRFQ